VNPVQQFEQAFAEYVGAKHAVAMCNGTATLHVALLALGVKPGDRVATTPLTMSATSIAILHAGAVPVFCDVDPDTWLMGSEHGVKWAIPVSLYGLHVYHRKVWADTIDDAAQTMRPHDEFHNFTSYSFQASKILPLGEGGMLVTNDDDLARLARSYASLGYDVQEGGKIDKRALKDPGFARHHRLGWNYRMAPAVARDGLRVFQGWGQSIHANRGLSGVDDLLHFRRLAASHYREAVQGVPWITPQHVPAGFTHDHWAYAVALESADLWHPLADAIERHGGTRPFAAWRLTYQEPAFRHLAPDGTCPVAESLQPRIMAFQTNSIPDAERNAEALSKAIREVGE
jgi:perosamine synthetase